MREISDPIWKEAQNLSKKTLRVRGDSHDYIQVPINQEEDLPSSDELIPKGIHTSVVNLQDINLYYLIGRWLGDGWNRFEEYESTKKNRYTFVICCAFNELQELEDKFKLTNLTYTVSKERTVYRLMVYSKELVYFMKQFGNRASNKRLNGLLLNLPISYARKLLEGYIDADGNTTGDVTSIGSISKELLLGIQSLVYKVYKTPTTFVTNNNNGRTPCVFEGRVCNLNTSYTLSFRKEGTMNKKHTQGFYDDENKCMWLPFRNSHVVKSDSLKVYNLSVEEDESYTVNNVGVHNCSLFSHANLVADNMKGQNSSKFNCVESAGVEQVLDELYQPAIELCGKLRPKVFIIENVVGLTYKKNKVYVDDIYYRLSELGYKTMHKIVKGEEIGLPQKRNRVFFISIREDLEWNDFNLEFNEPKVLINDVVYTDTNDKPQPPRKQEILKNYQYGDKDCGVINYREEGKRSMFNTNLPVITESTFYTLTTKSDANVLVVPTDSGFVFKRPTSQQLIQAQSFPLDYNFNSSSIYYPLGMSVAPLMIAKIVERIEEHILHPFYVG